MKDKLIQHYVNLYRILWGSNANLWTEDLEKMTERELKSDIRDMQRAVQEKNQYFPGLREDKK